MDSTIIATIITAFVTLTICIINNLVLNNKNKAENEKAINLIQYQITELKDEVAKSNNVKERTVKLEGMALVWEIKLQSLEERLSRLENDGR